MSKIGNSFSSAMNNKAADIAYAAKLNSQSTSTQPTGFNSNEDREGFNYFQLITPKVVLYLLMSLCFLSMIYITYDYFTSESESTKSPETFQELVSDSSSDNEANDTVSGIDLSDREDSEREIYSAKSKAGFFQRMFCKGGQKYAFCGES